MQLRMNCTHWCMRGCILGFDSLFLQGMPSNVTHVEELRIFTTYCRLLSEGGVGEFSKKKAWDER